MQRAFVDIYLLLNCFFLRLINANVSNMHKYIEIETKSTNIILFGRINLLYIRVIGNAKLYIATTIVLSITIHILSLRDNLKQ